MLLWGVFPLKQKKQNDEEKKNYNSYHFVKAHEMKEKKK